MSEKIVQLNEEVIKGQIKELVRGSVEETLNELLEKEAESLTQAARYERSETRQGYRSGHYDRNLTTTSGDVTLHVPRLKGVSFETAIIERYRRRESSVEESLIEMYLAGVSVRRVEDITEVLWGSKVSPATISELNKKAYVHIEDWRNRPLQGGKYPYVYVDGIYLRRNWGGEYENVAILVAIAVNEDGFREVFGAAEGMKEDKASWVGFFRWLRGRGLNGVKLIVGDKCLGMLSFYGKTSLERCSKILNMTILPYCDPSRAPKFQCLLLDAGPMQEWCEGDGAIWHGVSWTLSIGRSPGLPAGNESLLWQILQASVPQRYYLSPGQCSRILSFAARVGCPPPKIIERLLLMQGGRYPSSCPFTVSKCEVPPQTETEANFSAALESGQMCFPLC